MSVFIKITRIDGMNLWKFPIIFHLLANFFNQYKDGFNVLSCDENGQEKYQQQYSADNSFDIQIICSVNINEIFVSHQAI